MKNLIEKLVTEALAALPPGTLGDAALPVPEIERSRDLAHGDFACSIAMRLAKPARANPRALATKIIAALPANELIARTEIAGPGFINFFMTPAAWQAEVARVHAAGAAYGRGDAGAGRSAIVEFVSANPTGPLHVGHGRQAAFGATVANLLEADGWRVHREYYVNDAGRQMDILAASVWLRYLEACGETIAFPSNGYRGDYVRPIAAALHARQGDALRRPAAAVFAGLPPDEPEGGDKDLYVDAVIARAKELLGDAGFGAVFDAGLDSILADIRADLADFGVHFDRWYSERDLGDGRDGGPIDRALQRLRAHGHVFEQEGAVWFRATAFGDEKDRVVVRANGQKTYFASDIAYHLDKRERGFDLLVDDPRRRPSRLRRARARGPRGDGRAAGIAAGADGAVRHPVQGRREGGDGQARGAVRHAARPAHRGRQRRRAAHLRDALERPAARLRPRAREEAEQRQPGLLPAVRARAHRERAEAGRRARAAVRPRGGPRRARCARPANPSRR